jgi:hypothetical protein
MAHHIIQVVYARRRRPRLGFRVRPATLAFA